MSSRCRLRQKGLVAVAAVLCVFAPAALDVLLQDTLPRLSTVSIQSRDSQSNGLQGLRGSLAQPAVAWVVPPKKTLRASPPLPQWDATTAFGLQAVVSVRPRTASPLIALWDGGRNHRLGVWHVCNALPAADEATRLLLQGAAKSAWAGAVGALAAAFLSAFTEPVVNRVVGLRQPLKQAVADVRLTDIARYFRTVLTTNMLKYPYFEVLNVLKPPFCNSCLVHGIFSGFMYTTVMLPVLNYRYAMSLQIKVRKKRLYRAYWPTLLRDIVYGVARQEAMKWLVVCWPVFAVTLCGRCVHTFIAVMLGCIASSPFNEFRAYLLQPRGSRLPLAKFFEFAPLVRSCLLGSIIPSISLAVGQLLVAKAINVLAIVARALPICFTFWAVIRFELVALIVSAIGVMRLEKKQYYDPYTLPRGLKVMVTEILTNSNSGGGSSPQVAGTSGAVAGRFVGPKRDAQGQLQPTSSAAGMRASDRESLDSESANSGADGSNPAGPVTDDDSDNSSSSIVPTAQTLFRFVAPAACLVIANSSMSAVDKIFIGRHSSLQLAALGPATTAFDGTSFLLTFLNTATLSLLGLASGGAEETRRVRSHALILASGAALVLGGLLFVTASTVVRGLGATPEMLGFSASYLRVRALGAPIERGASVSTSFCLAAKDGTTPLMVTLIGLVVNVVLDGFLCPRYGSTGVAVASVMASAVGYGYLISSLAKQGLWPSPLSWPRGTGDIVRFLGYAGPVLVAMLLKTMVFAHMTQSACALGTASAAGHQIFFTLFLLSAVALGNPFSWAAQAFLPPLLRRGVVERAAVAPVGDDVGSTGTGEDSMQLQPIRDAAVSGSQSLPRPVAEVALRRLIGGAVVSSFVVAWLVVLFCRRMSWLFSSDPLVVQEIAGSCMALVPFATLYPVLLTFEGALYSAQKRSLALVVSAVFWLFSYIAVELIQTRARLTLSSLWIGSGVACGLATCVTAALAFRSMRLLAAGKRAGVVGSQ